MTTISATSQKWKENPVSEAYEKEEHETWNKDSYLKSKSLLNTCHYGCQFIVYAN
jgi:hypothetical protein